MIALRLKDLLVMRRTLRSYMIFLALYTLMAVKGMFDLSVVTAMIQVILLMLPVG